MQSFEDSLRQQDKLKPPYGECHHCHDTGHWIGDCPEAKKLREQQMSTNKEKPAYGRCYICGLVVHWAPNCPKREEDFTSQQTESSVSTERQQIESAVFKRSKRLSLQYQQRNLPGNVRLLSQLALISPPKRRCFNTRSKKTAIRGKTGKKPYCFISKSDSYTSRSCTQMVAEN